MPAITLTPSAVKELRHFYKEHEVGEEVVVAIGVQGGGCSGFQFTMKTLPKEQISPGKYEICEQEGITVAVDKRSCMYIHGTVVDYCELINKRGFVFNNPSATGKCGCGSSFSI